MKTFKTVEECLKFLKIDKKKMPDFSSFEEKDQTAFIAHYKIIKVVEAHCKANGNWKPDWSKSSEYKYYPWFFIKADKKNPSGSGLAYYDYDCAYSRSSVGSRLCLPSRELARHIGETFAELYKDYFLFNE